VRTLAWMPIEFGSDTALQTAAATLPGLSATVGCTP
jgi:hypothetical protein